MVKNLIKKIVIIVRYRKNNQKKKFNEKKIQKKNIFHWKFLKILNIIERKIKIYWKYWKKYYLLFIISFFFYKQKSSFSFQAKKNFSGNCLLIFFRFFSLMEIFVIILKVFCWNVYWSFEMWTNGFFRE